MEFHTTVTDFDAEHMTAAATPGEIFVCRGTDLIHVRVGFRKTSFHGLVVETNDRKDLVWIHARRSRLCDFVSPPHVNQGAVTNGKDYGIGIFVCNVRTERDVAMPVAIAKSPRDESSRIYRRLGYRWTRRT